VYLINFDDNDSAVNQPYDDRVNITGVDTNNGDPVSEGADDQLGMVHWTVRPDMVGFLKVPWGGCTSERSPTGRSTRTKGPRTSTRSGQT
jgi:hypothetical protein